MRNATLRTSGLECHEGNHDPHSTNGKILLFTYIQIWYKIAYAMSDNQSSLFLLLLSNGRAGS